MIGHLQTNKVRRLLRYQPLIHSVDSERLLGVIAKESVAREVKTRVLLEVNISGDAEKTGMSATQLEELMQQPIPEGIEVVGLMAMAGLAADSGQIQRQFDAVRELVDHLVTASGLALPELSMGMSGKRFSTSNSCWGDHGADRLEIIRRVFWAVTSLLSSATTVDASSKRFEQFATASH